MKLHYLVIPCLLLASCNLVEVEPVETELAPEQTEPVRETENVTYSGVVQPAGISVYQQGSHRLVLPGGKFVLLESNSVDLNGYVDEEVQIYGSLRPTVEAGGMIMRVDTIELLNPSSEQSSSSEDSSLSDSETSASQTSSSDSSSTLSSDASSEQSSETSSSAPSAAYRENIELMSKQDYAGANWTQQYCTSHVEFCIPVHRNFWYKSFGATGTALWHVEFSGAPIENLSDGPIVLELIAGSAGSQDGTIDTGNGKVTAYKEWTFGRHFRITADESLIEAVEYMSNNITEYTQ